MVKTQGKQLHTFLSFKSIFLRIQTLEKTDEQISQNLGKLKSREYKKKFGLEEDALSPISKRSAREDTSNSS